MTESTQEKPINLVLDDRTDHLTSIGKLELLFANILYISRLESCLNDPFHRAIHLIIFVLYEKCTDRWMVRNLLHINLSSVLPMAFECFAQDGIEWLIKALIVNYLCNLRRNDHFQALYRVILKFRCQVHIEGHAAEVLRDHSQCCCATHAFDGETYSGQVELTIQNLATC